MLSDLSSGCLPKEKQKIHALKQQNISGTFGSRLPPAVKNDSDESLTLCSTTTDSFKDKKINHDQALKELSTGDVREHGPNINQNKDDCENFHGRYGFENSESSQGDLTQSSQSDTRYEYENRSANKPHLQTSRKGDERRRGAQNERKNEKRPCGCYEKLTYAQQKNLRSNDDDLLGLNHYVPSVKTAGTRRSSKSLSSPRRVTLPEFEMTTDADIPKKFCFIPASFTDHSLHPHLYLESDEGTGIKSDCCEKPDVVCYGGRQNVNQQLGREKQNDPELDDACIKRPRYQRRERALSEQNRRKPWQESRGSPIRTAPINCGKENKTRGRGTLREECVPKECKCSCKCSKNRNKDLPFLTSHSLDWPLPSGFRPLDSDCDFLDEHEENEFKSQCYKIIYYCPSESETYKLDEELDHLLQKEHKQHKKYMAQQQMEKRREKELQEEREAMERNKKRGGTMKDVLQPECACTRSQTTQTQASSNTRSERSYYSKTKR